MAPRDTLLLKPATPAASDGTPGTKPPSKLSSEVLAQAGSRLSLFAGAVGAVVFFSVVLQHVLVYGLGWPAQPRWHDVRWIQLGLVALSLVTCVLGRNHRIEGATMINVALGYEILGGFLVALESWVSGTLIQSNPLVISWLCVWIVMFPLIIPATPARNIFAAFAAASTGPLLLSYCVLAGHATPTKLELVGSFLPSFLSAALSIVPAFAIYRTNASLTVAQRKLRELGSYQLVKLLGKGGMGEVWQAEHRMLARPAAIKLVQPAALDGESQASRGSLLKRFEQEARVTSSLSSPHTVSLYDFGTAADGTFYYVMELLHGLDLESLVSRFGPVPPARAVHILAQACESLAEAHEAGLIHRDIKPANLYLCRMGIAHDFLKVLDFGLVTKARGCQACDAKGEKLTGEHTIVGTPLFMSPEMAQGTPIDGRADIYALGCVAYWLLTGTFVFEGDRPPMQILMDHIGKKPVRPSARLGKPLPASLEDLVLQCLEKDPRNRPATALELARALRACTLDDTWTDGDARAWWHENLKDLATGQAQPGLATTVVRALHATETAALS